MIWISLILISGMLFVLCMAASICIYTRIFICDTALKIVGISRKSKWNTICATLSGGHHTPLILYSRVTICVDENSVRAHAHAYYCYHRPCYDGI